MISYDAKIRFVVLMEGDLGTPHERAVLYLCGQLAEYNEGTPG